MTSSTREIPGRCPSAPSNARWRRRLPETGTFLVCWLFTAGCILALTWPWCLHFDGYFLNHWDPPFHAWKLEVMARKILAGDLLFWNAETPLFYPHTGTLYFEALTWPTALVAAVLFAWTPWSAEYIYHVVLILFWAASAPCMRLFLRELGLRGAAATVGGILFCILPYRMSYANEFQMQLTFAIPLFYLLLTRFMKTGTVRYAVGLALMWWLFAVTELYQAVFILFTLPFILLAHFSGDTELLRRRRFWVAAVIGGLTGVLSLPIMLTPYLRHKAAGTVMRAPQEVVRHSIQPLSYLVPFGKYQPWSIDAKTEELWGYPTIAILLLTVAALVYWLAGQRRQTPRATWIQLLPAIPLAALLCGYALITGLLQIHPQPEPVWIVDLWKAMPVLCTAGAILFCFSRESRPSRRFMIGLFAAAVFCFFLSLGPTMDLHQPPAISVRNNLYMALYKHTPLLSGFRAACRFGVFVMFFLVCAAACALHELGRTIRRHAPGRSGRLLGACLAAGAIAAVAVESIPTDRYLTFRHVDRIADCPVVQRLEKRIEPYVLAVFPMGARQTDGMVMFALLKDRYLSVYGWAGFFPDFAQAVMKSAERGDVRTTAALLDTLWPESLLLIDRSIPVGANPSFVEAYPPHYTTCTEAGAFVDFPGMFSEVADVIDQDNRLTLMRLRPQMPSIHCVKRFRSDLVRRYPESHGTLLSDAAAKISIAYNGQFLADLHLQPGVPCPWSAHLDKHLAGKTGDNEIVFSGDAPFSLSSFHLANDDASIKAKERKDPK